MINFIFTLDYEIYGNGAGSLRELVHTPTEQLASIFHHYGARFVVFAEVAEIQKIDEYRCDDALEDVKRQLRQLYEQGFEIGLHLHPWWFNARFESNTWHLDWSERNICTLPAPRVKEMVTQAIDYLRDVLGDPQYVPASFRSGTWVMQPTPIVSEVLVEAGLTIDSSVFKGGRSRHLGFDYRTALRNGHYWRFKEDVCTPDASGRLMEIPIHTEMQPFWKMLSLKRLRVHSRNMGAGNAVKRSGGYLDLLRFRYPRKLDFCRMSFEEMRRVIDRLIVLDQSSPDSAKPIVAIGHSKDLVDIKAVNELLHYLQGKDISITTFQGFLQNVVPAA